jgi:hypothetical protein
MIGSAEAASAAVRAANIRSPTASRDSRHRRVTTHSGKDKRVCAVIESSTGQLAHLNALWTVAAGDGSASLARSPEDPLCALRRYRLRDCRRQTRPVPGCNRSRAMPTLLRRRCRHQACRTWPTCCRMSSRLQRARLGVPDLRDLGRRRNCASGNRRRHRRAPDRSERRIAPQSMTVAARADGLFVARSVQRSDRRRNDVPSATSGSLALRHNHVVCFNFAVTLPGLRNRDFDQLRVSPHGKQQ